MKCSRCGTELAVGMRFCASCGEEVGAIKKDNDRTCTYCGAKLLPYEIYCCECGRKFEQTPAMAEEGTDFADTAAAQKQPINDSVPNEAVTSDESFASANLSQEAASPGKLLITQKMISIYKGEPKLGIAEATGTLLVYDDRIELQKHFGNSAGALFGLVGMIAAKNKTKENPVLTYRFTEIKSLRCGKYAGALNSLVMDLKDGKTYSLVPATPSQMAQNIINITSQYIKK